MTAPAPTRRRASPANPIARPDYSDHRTSESPDYRGPTVYQEIFILKKLPSYGTSVITDTMQNDIIPYGIVKNKLLGEVQLYILCR